MAFLTGREKTVRLLLMDRMQEIAEVCNGAVLIEIYLVKFRNGYDTAVLGIMLCVASD